MSLARLHELFEKRQSLGPPDAIGIITQAVPIEIILAAGLAPCRVFGDPSQAPTIGARYMEDEIDGEVRSVFDQLLRGRYGTQPLILLPRVTEQHLQLHYYIQEVRNWEPDAAIPPVEIVDIMQTAYWLTGRYVRARMDDLADIVGGIGNPVTAAALREAIATTNAMRRALQAANALRRDGRLKGSDVFRLTALFGALPAEEFLDLARAVANEAGNRVHGPRVMLSGSAPGDPGIYEVIESLGASVVVDEHVTGERIFARLIDEDLDPFEAITEHYQLYYPGVRQFPQKPQDDRFAATCRDARIDADICVLETGDDTLGWDWPRRRDRLQSLGIRSHLLAHQDYFRPDRNAQVAAVKSFLAAVMEEVQ